MVPEPVRVAYLCEGSTDAGFLPAVCGKLVDVELAVVLTQQLGGYAALRSKLKGWLRLLRHYQVELAIAVVDNDHQAHGKRLREVEQACSRAGNSAVAVVIGVAVEMIEAWLLATPAAFRKAYDGRAPKLRGNRAPESIYDPKKEILIPFLESEHEIRLTIARASEIGRHADVARIERLCPSFREFAVRLRKAVGRRGRP